MQDYENATSCNVLQEYYVAVINSGRWIIYKSSVYSSAERCAWTKAVHESSNKLQVRFSKHPRRALLPPVGWLNFYTTFRY